MVTRVSNWMRMEMAYTSVLICINGIDWRTCIMLRSRTGSVLSGMLSIILTIALLQCYSAFE